MAKTAWKGCFASLFFAAAVLTTAQQQSPQPQFNGVWQMDTTKSQVSDGRVLTVAIATQSDSIKITVTTKKDGQTKTTEFTSKLNGKACEVAEQGHTSKMTVWFDGATLNACKENGPASDVSSLWKFDVSPDKNTMTMKINHYEPTADDETIVFNRKS